MSAPRALAGGAGALLLALGLGAGLAATPARCEPAPGGSPALGDEAVSRARATALAKLIEGEWVGARLLCRKEEDNAVRCGKPVDFSVTFSADGTGSSSDEHFPRSFAYRWESKSEMVLTPRPAGKELTLFQLEIEKGFLTFQTYIHLAADKDDPQRAASYIHYIFDVHRVR